LLWGAEKVNQNVRLTRKEDGSLGIIYHYNGEWRVNTRGSFKSRQAQWALEWMKTHINLDELVPGNTYLAEIVYRKNIIVIPYKFEGLIWLGVV